MTQRHKSNNVAVHIMPQLSLSDFAEDFDLLRKKLLQANVTNLYGELSFISFCT